MDLKDLEPKANNCTKVRKSAAQPADTEFVWLKDFHLYDES